MKQTSHRQNKRLTIESADKKLIRMRKRMFELWSIRRKLPYIPLDKPIQRGFKKSYVLREAESRRKDARDLSRILGVINHTIYCKNEDFKSKKYHNNQMEDIPHTLRHIPDNQWDKLEWPDHYKKWFTYETRTKQGAFGTHYEVKGYYFKFPWMFEPKTSPNFITHVQEVDPNVESEIKEINQYFDNHNGWPRLGKLSGTNNNKWRQFESSKEALLQDVIIREEMDEFEDNYLDP